MLRLPGLGKHGRTTRWDPRTTLVLVALAMLAPVAGAASTVKLSDPLASIQSALHAATNSKPPQGTTGGAVSPIALVIDGQPIDPTATETILRAIDDCRRDGGSVVAICARTARKNNNGAALVALAANTIVFLEGSELEGVDDAWCTSASTRDDILARFTRMAALDPQLAGRVMGSQGALSWSSKVGFKPDLTGAVKIAEAGKPIVLDAALMKRLGLACEEAATMDEAQAAIAAGNLKTRVLASAPTGSSAPALGGGAPRGKGAPSGVPASAPPTAPSGKVSPEIAAKLEPKIKDYAATLAALMVTLAEFEPYFDGSKGNWGTGYSGLRQIWEHKAVNNADGDTKIRSQRLIRDISTKVSALGVLASSIEKIAKDAANLEARRIKERQAILHDLDAAIEHHHGAEFAESLRLLKALK